MRTRDDPGWSGCCRGCCWSDDGRLRIGTTTAAAPEFAAAAAAAAAAAGFARALSCAFFSACCAIWTTLNAARSARESGGVDGTGAATARASSCEGSKGVGGVKLSLMAPPLPLPPASLPPSLPPSLPCSLPSRSGVDASRLLGGFNEDGGECGCGCCCCDPDPVVAVVGDKVLKSGLGLIATLCSVENMTRLEPTEGAAAPPVSAPATEEPPAASRLRFEPDRGAAGMAPAVETGKAGAAAATGSTATGAT